MFQSQSSLKQVISGYLGEPMLAPLSYSVINRAQHSPLQQTPHNSPPAQRPNQNRNQDPPSLPC